MEADPYLNTSKRVIGLFGPKGSGKTTVADYLVQTAGFVRMAFADPIREMLGVIVPPEYCDPYADKNAPIEELCGCSVRHAMKTLGTEWGRNLIGSDLWLRILLRRVILSKATKIVIDDLRMLNEYWALRLCEAFDFSAVRVDADERIGPSTDTHPTEREWRSMTADAVIQNISGRDTLGVSVRRALACLSPEFGPV